MITVINKSNKGLYNELFEKVQNWLYTHDSQGNEVEPFSDQALLGYVQVENENGELVNTDEPEIITSLEELFTKMESITKHAEIYTRLPLDEEPFFIDANKRTISVPKDFAANGVSVQGDEIAEVLFFKINRFFDATDLAEQDILIQWKSSEVDENGKQKEGASKPWIRDIESQPGYLIFGWPISSKITKAAGPVTFSVRFYSLSDVDKLEYSFSTLDQTVVIKPALDYDIESVAKDTVFTEDASNTIQARAKDSVDTSSNLEPPVLEWEAGILDALYSDEYVYATDSEQGWRYAHLGIDENGFSSQPLTFVIAAISDKGIVQYNWKKVDGVSNTLDEKLSDGETPYYQVVVYMEDNTSERDRDSAKTYYLFENDRYRAIGTEENLDDLRAEDKVVYQLVSTAIADEVGRYKGAAKARYGKSPSEELTTDMIWFLKPGVPEIGEGTLNTSNGVVLKGEPTTLSLAELTLNDEEGRNEEAKGCKATYVWHHKSLDKVNTEDVSTDAELILTDPATDEGWYSVTVTNNLNNKTADATSEEIRVTKAANKLTVSIDVDDEVNVTAARTRQMHLPVYVDNLESVRDERTEDNPDGEDYVTYQWYWYREGSGNAKNDRDAAKEGMYADGTNGVNGDIRIEDIRFNDVPITDEAVLNSATTPNFIPPEGIEGTYFCVVTNHYNGDERSVASPFYSVTL